MHGKVAATLAMVAGLALLAGCSWQTTVPKPFKEPVKIEFWHGAIPDSPTGKTLTKLVDQFNRSQTDVFVTASYQGSYADLEQKVSAASKVGKPPAVVQATDSMLDGLVYANRVAALDSLIPPAELADYAPSLLNPLTVDGRHYALPFARSVAVMFYNTRLVPQAPRTWAELRTTAADVAEETDAGIALTPDVYTFAPFFYQAGGQWLKNRQPAFAGPEGTAALQFMQDMVQDGSVALLAPREYPADYLNTGRVGMVIAASTNLPYVHSQDGDTIAVAQVPAGKAGALTASAGTSLVILQGTKPAEQQAAAKFIQWLTSRDATLQLATTGAGWVPVRVSALADPVWQTYVKANPAFAAVSNAIGKASAQPIDPMWGEVQAKITAAVQGALNDDEAPADALATAQEAARNLLR